MTEQTIAILDGFTFDIEGKTAAEIDLAFSLLSRINKSKATLFIMTKSFDSEDKKQSEELWQLYERLEQQRSKF